MLGVICKNFQANVVAAKDLVIRPLATITETTALAIGLLASVAFATKWGEGGSLYAFVNFFIEILKVKRFTTIYKIFLQSMENTLQI